MFEPRYASGAFEDAIELVSSGKVNIKALISHAYKFSDSLQAFDAMLTGEGQGRETGKVVILNEKFVDPADFATERYFQKVCGHKV